MTTDSKPHNIQGRTESDAAPRGGGSSIGSTDEGARHGSVTGSTPGRSVATAPNQHSGPLSEMKRLYEDLLADKQHLEEQHGALQQKYDALWQEQEHPFDKSEYDRLFEQFESVLSLAEHLFQMIPQEVWREHGAEWMGQYEGDHHAEKVLEQLRAWRDSNPATSSGRGVLTGEDAVVASSSASRSGVSSPATGYDGLVEVPTADSDVCHTEESSPASIPNAASAPASGRDGTAEAASSDAARPVSGEPTVFLHGLKEPLGSAASEAPAGDERPAAQGGTASQVSHPASELEGWRDTSGAPAPNPGSVAKEQR